MSQDYILKQIKDKEKGHYPLGCAYDYNFESDKWTLALPWFRFPEHWLVKIVPPNLSAIIRFIVSIHDGSDRNMISVYFHNYKKNNYSGNKPYWEVDCPQIGEIIRFNLGDEENMIVVIDKFLQLGI